MAVLLAACHSVPSEDEVCSAFDPRPLVSLEDTLNLSFGDITFGGGLAYVTARSARDSARAFEFLWRNRWLRIDDVWGWPDGYWVTLPDYDLSSRPLDGARSRWCPLRVEIWPDTVYISTMDDK